MYKQNTLDKSSLPTITRKHNCLNCGVKTPKNSWSFCGFLCRDAFKNNKVKYNTAMSKIMRSQLLTDNPDIANRITPPQEICVRDAEIKTTDDGNTVVEFLDINGAKWGTFASQVIGFVKGKFREHLKSVLDADAKAGLDLFFYTGTSNTGREMIKVSLFKQ